MLTFRKTELRPNCLITRYPVVFIKSTFKHRKLAHDLREHGYDIRCIDSIVLSIDRVQMQLDHLADSYGGFHLFSEEKETCWKGSLSTTKLLPPEPYAPARYLDYYLDLLVKLAEEDFIRGASSKHTV